MLKFTFQGGWFTASIVYVLWYWVNWREWMRNEQLKSVDVLANSVESNIDCSSLFMQKYRSLTGICNHFEYPEMGAIGTRFAKNHPINNTFGETENDTLLTPNPRDIARELLWQNDNRGQVKATHLNLFVASWIQFMVHDWVKHNTSKANDDILIPIDNVNDPLFGIQSFMDIERSSPNTHGTKDGDELRPNPIYPNVVTAWWDGSQLYGIDSDTNAMVRDASDPAKMRINYDNAKREYRLPIDSDGKEIAGEQDNWWLGLSLLHKLFVLEHNYIIDGLRKEYGTKYDNEELYHIARLIISALMAKIHTVEWTPAILWSDTIKIGLDVNFYGKLQIDWLLNKKVDFMGAKREFIKNEDYGHIFQMLRYILSLEPTALEPDAKRNLFGLKYYQFTESFVSVYRLHPLIPDNITINGDLLDTRTVMLHPGAINTQDTYEANDLMYAFGANNPTALHLNGYPDMFKDIFIPHFNKTIDLATYDVIRQRERGVPRYNTFREGMGLPKITSLTELTDDTDLINKILTLYNNDIELIDLTIGMFLENEGGKRVPKGWIFGETQFAVFLAAASNRLKMDRFYTDNFNAEYYTEFGMQYILDNTFKSIILRNFPDLDGYLPENAFFTFYNEKKKANNKATKYSLNWNIAILNYIGSSFIWIMIVLLTVIYVYKMGNDPDYCKVNIKSDATTGTDTQTENEI